MKLVELAKQAVENYVKENRIIALPEDLPRESLTKKAGVFITIKKGGRLRGCIGTYLPTKENIALEIIHNAIAAATQDYRFGAVRQEELSNLTYTVYILHEPQLVSDSAELDPKKYGIIVKTTPTQKPDGANVFIDGHLPRPYKTGLLLPDLEGINTAQEQIAAACDKAGVDPAQEKIIIYKFAVEKYE